MERGFWVTGMEKRGEFFEKVWRGELKGGLWGGGLNMID